MDIETLEKAQDLYSSACQADSIVNMLSQISVLEGCFVRFEKDECKIFLPRELAAKVINEITSFYTERRGQSLKEFKEL